MRSSLRRLALGIVVLVSLATAAGCGQSAQAPFRIGVLADCTGISAESHDWSLAAAELPLLQHGGRLAGKGPAGGVSGATVAGRPVEIVEGCSETGIYGRLITETRQLVEIDHVDAVVGAYGWSDAVVFRELARRYPTVPFLVAGLVRPRGDACTIRRPTCTASARTSSRTAAGLATYAYRTLGWRSAATVAEESPNGWGAVAAFEAEFCALGGSVQRIWTPPFAAGRAAPAPGAAHRPTASWSSRSTDSPPFIRAYVARHPDAARSLLLDLWLYAPDELAAYAGLWPQLRGVVGHLAGRAGSLVAAPTRPIARPSRRRFRGCRRRSRATSRCSRTTPPWMPSCSPSRRRTGEVGADRAQLRAALASLRLATPAGAVRLDRNRQAIVPVDARRNSTAARRDRPRSIRCAASRPSTRRSAACSRRSVAPSPAHAGLPPRRAAALGALSVSSPAAGSSR